MKKVFTVLILIMAMILLVACIDKDNNDNLQNENSEEVEEEKRDKIKTVLDTMTLNEKIGQLLIVGFDGTTVDENITDLIENKHIGGVVFFGSNVESVSSVISLTNNFKSINSKNKVPLFISVDEEGGVVSRTPDEFKKLPSASYVGSFYSEEICYKEGTIIADELKLMGYNIDYAPVLDILSNPENTVIGKRAFGTTAYIVSKLGIKVMKGLQDNEVISVIKHFPGHGDTLVDSHYGLPLVKKSLDELKALEFIPFEESIENGADAIMVSHILLERIDSENPASMSKIVISDILRGDMGFNGVIISDDMTMGAIVDNYDIKDAAIKSINAGVDLLLVCHEYDKEIEVINAIEGAVINGSISEERINESVYRILQIKDKYNLSNEPVSETYNVDSINNAIENLFN